MTEYTPTTEFVRSVYEQARGDAFEWEIATPEELADKESSNGERFDRWLAEVERAAAEKALMAVAEDWESGTVEHDEIKYTSDAPLGWSDESVVDAVMSSGPVMDWVRARAKAYRRNEGENDGAL